MTVATDLATATGIRPRLYAKIEGIEPILWQSDGTWTDAGGRAYPWRNNGTQVILSTTADEQFGSSADAYMHEDGDCRAVFGAPEYHTESGAAYVYARDPETKEWSQEGSPLVASVHEHYAAFGFAVAIWDTWIAVSAPWEHGAGTDRGAVYIFNDVGGTWTETQRITSPSPTDDYMFGYALSMANGRLVVGEPFGNGGRVHVYEETEGTWALMAGGTLTGSDTGTYDQFGSSVDLDATNNANLIVGAWEWDSGHGAAYDAGKAYIFTESGGTWTEQQALRDHDDGALSNYGKCVAIVGDRCFVGYPRDGYISTGCVEYWTRSGTTWTRQQNIIVSDNARNQNTPNSLSVTTDGQYLVLSHGGGADFANGGRLYWFELSGSSYVEIRGPELAPVAQRFQNNFFGGGDPTHTYYGSYSALAIIGDATDGIITISGGAGFASNNGGAVIYDETQLWYRSGLVCLHAPKEFSTALDLGTMTTSLSALTLVLDDVQDTDGTSYFGKLFAPGRWDSVKHWRVAEGSTYNDVVDANAAAIPLNCTYGIGTGLRYLGRETLNVTASNATHATATRGLYPPHAASGTWASTYPRPMASQNGRLWGIGTYPFSLAGRRICLYCTTYDDANARWHSESESVLLWAGRIAAEQFSIKQDGRTGRWHVGCVSIMEDLKKKIATDMPTAKLKGINLTGSHGRKFRAELKIWSHDQWLRYAEETFEVPAAHYANASALCMAVNDLIGNWARTTFTQEDVYIHLWRPDGEDKICVRVCGPGATPAWAFQLRLYDDWTGEQYRSHVLNALGITNRTISNPFTVTYDPEADGHHMEEAADDKYYESYHPNDPGVNGGYLYVDDVGKLWTDQGDGSSALARVEIAKYEDRFDSTIADGQIAYYNYTGVDAANDRLTGITSILSSTYTLGCVGHRVGEEQVDIKNVLWPQTTTPFTQLLYPLLSTGTRGYNHATYDRLPLQCALAVPASLVDIASFTDADKEISASPLANRMRHPIRDIGWLELAQRECQLFGYAVVWNAGQICLKRVLSPDLNDISVVLDDSTRASWKEMPDLMMQLGSVINEYKLEIVNPDNNKTWETYIFTDVDSTMAMATKRVEVKHAGIWLDGIADVGQMLRPAFMMRPLRFPRPTVEVSLPRTMINRVGVGDTVTFTSSVVQDPCGSGTRSCSVPATVLDLSWDYATWTGRAQLLLHTRARTPWAPSAIINMSTANSGWDVSTGTLTLVPHTFSNASFPHDGDCFAAGDYLRIIPRYPSNPSSAGAIDVLVNRAYWSNVCTLQLENTSLDPWTNVARVVTFSKYGTVRTAQESNGVWQANVGTSTLDVATKDDVAQRYA